MTSDFDYKKYSLEKLQEWIHDAMSTDEASPHEIYSAIREAVREDYYYYKHHCSRAGELLELLNGNGKSHIQGYDDFECPLPEQHNGSTVSNVPSYYNSVMPSSTQRNIDKVKKWVLPVEECKDADTDETEYFVSFPDDLLEAASLKEGDQVEWVDQGDGSYLLRKVTQPLRMDEC